MKHIYLLPVLFLSAVAFGGQHTGGGLDRAIQLSSDDYSRLDLRLAIRDTAKVPNHDLEVKRSESREIVSLDETVKVVRKLED